MTFLQIIEYETDRPEELDELFHEWLAATEGKRTVQHELHTRNRDDPSHFVDIVEFASYEAAMWNNELSETRRITEQMRACCRNGPRFLNLDVLRDDNL
jgi:hypothetical protein